MKKKVALDLPAMLGKLQSRKKLSQAELEGVCLEAIKVFGGEPSLVKLTAPIRVCGDIHGQFEDLLKIFDKLGRPDECKYLFLGDYVDRGRSSVQTIIYLCILKLRHPKQIFLLRGNHECARLNKLYGFYEECVSKYNSKVWNLFCELFNHLPVSALVEDKILCMHGGISPSLLSIDHVNKIVRPTEIPEDGLLCDILWSDPSENHDGWEENERGVSFTFGKTALKTFLLKNELELIVRGHQVVEEGYQFFADRKLVTLFSAPNYCGEFDNKGAVLSLNEDLVISFDVLKPITKLSKKGVKLSKNY